MSHAYNAQCKYVTLIRYGKVRDINQGQLDAWWHKLSNFKLLKHVEHHRSPSIIIKNHYH